MYYVDTFDNTLQRIPHTYTHMLDPSADPAFVGNPSHRPLLLGRPHQPQELSVSSDNSDVVQQQAQPTTTVRRIKHFGGGKDSGAPVYPWLAPVFYVVGTTFFAVATIILIVMAVKILPVVNNISIVASGAAEKMPGLLILAEEFEIAATNKSRAILQSTLDAMASFSSTVEVIDAHISDPDFQNNVEAVVSAFVEQDVKAAVTEVKNTFAAVTRLTDSVRNNGLSAQFVVPLMSTTPTTTTIAP
jgi:hypothetical protein